MTIKEAFQKLTISLSASMKNPFFIGRRLYQDFADIADNIEEGGSGSTHEYSTDEHVVGKWIDDKDIYEIVYTGTKTSNQGIAITDEIDYIDKIISINLSVTSNNDTQIGQYYRENLDFCRCWFENNVFLIDSGSSYPALPYNYRVVVQYTKKTV